MPTFRGITVEVVVDPGRPLQEWGVQHFPRANTISCYIESTAGLRFEISLRPEIPFHSKHYRDFDLLTRPGPSCSGKKANHRPGSEGYNHRLPPKPVVSAPDFHFIASLYLDGRSKPERRAILYTNPDEPEFRHPDGHAFLKTRWVQGRDGLLREHSWYFSNVGVETLFDQLVLDKGIGTPRHRLRPSEQDELVSALDAVGLDPECDKTKEENLRVGQIVVEVRRVVLGTRWESRHFKPKHREGDEEDVVMAGAGAGADKISHTVSVGGGTIIPVRVPVVSYSLYNEDEGPFAKFQFFYRGADKLRRFNFFGFPQSKSSDTPIDTSALARNRRKINFDFVTPLTLTGFPLSRGTPTSSSTFQEAIRKLQEARGPNATCLTPLTKRSETDTILNLDHTSGFPSTTNTNVTFRASSFGSFGSGGTASFTAQGWGVSATPRPFVAKNSCESEPSVLALRESLSSEYRQSSNFSESDADDERDSDANLTPRSPTNLSDEGNLSPIVRDDRLQPHPNKVHIGAKFQNGNDMPEVSEVSLNPGKRVRSLDKMDADHAEPAVKTRRGGNFQRGGSPAEDGSDVPNVTITFPKKDKESFWT